MSDVRIDELRLSFADAGRHVHRVRPICRQATAVLGTLLAERPLRPGAERRVERLGAHVELDLDRMSDEQASRRLAEGVYAALAGERQAPAPPRYASGAASRNAR